MQFFKVSIAAALATAVAAQNNTVIPCCTVPVSQVPQDTRQEWCNAQQNTCVDICGGQGDIASNGNSCDASTLDYKCSCNNGTTISDDVMKTFQQTVPAQMCYFWYDACINATFSGGEGNSAQQFQCTQARNTQCGNTTFDESSDGSSSQASATSSGSGGASRTSSAASGASGAAATGSSRPSSAADLLQALGTPALAGGLLAFFGLAL